jgi:hypothetical protein
MPKKYFLKAIVYLKKKEKEKILLHALRIWSHLETGHFLYWVFLLCFFDMLIIWSF